MRTPSQTVGPFYAIGLCRHGEHVLAAGAVELSGLLLDGQGEAIADGLVELWDSVERRWGRSGTDADGRFAFEVSKPGAGEHGAPHFEVFVFARGLLRHQLTRIYLPDEQEANAADPLLASLPEAERSTLVAAQEGDGLRFDIRMQGENATVFFEH